MCPACSHRRETDREFDILPQSANADSSLMEGAKYERHRSLTGLIFDSVGDKRMPPACIASGREPFILPPISTKQTNRLLPPKIPCPANGIESERLTCRTKKTVHSANSATHIILFPIVLPGLGKRAAIILQPFSGAYCTVFKCRTRPARFHRRETDGEFDI